MKPIQLALGFLGAACLSNVCCAQTLEDDFAQYVERGVTILPGAGNAKDVNAAIHGRDPWPPYASYTRIPGQGRRAVSSINRMYQYPNPFLPQQPGFGPGPSGGTIGAGAGGAGTEVGIGSVQGGAPMQPISGGY
jgi:hypothetical protein